MTIRPRHKYIAAEKNAGPRVRHTTAEDAELVLLHLERFETEYSSRKQQDRGKQLLEGIERAREGKTSQECLLCMRKPM
jgi:hypothetical protein